MTDVAVIGGGTMGAGIVETAALSGLSAIVIDVSEEALEKGLQTIQKDLDRRVDRGRISQDGRDQALSRISMSTSLEDCANSPVLIEAVIEDASVKKDLLSNLEEIVDEDAVLATNTSSLSVARIASSARHPGRVVGMHFFNPAPAMKLVEVAAGPMSDETALQRATELSERLGKTPIRVKDTPGFVVNRVARPFYLEALRLVEAGGEPAQIDAAIRGAGFRMGPLQLADLIGNDVNLSVSESIYERFYHQARFRPSPLQRSIVEADLLGRKSGRGFYEYSEDRTNEEESPSEPGGLKIVGDAELARALDTESEGDRLEVLALEDDATLIGSGFEVGVRRFTPESEVIELVGNVEEATRKRVEAAVRAAGLTPAWTPDLPGGAALRVVSALANEAAFAHAEGVASADDIDRAMQLGANYPKGPLARADEIGPDLILRVLDALREVYGDAYLAAPLLRKRAASGQPLSATA